MKLSELSVFYPAYNEAGNIEEVIHQSLAFLPKVAKKFEIIIINDGSTDSTLQIAKRLSEKHRTVRVINQRNRGYGGALKRGFKAARYEWIFFSDSDLQFDLSELQSFIPFTKEYSLILGYRLQRAEGFKRQLLASALKIWNRTLLGFPRKIKDIDCAFKLLHVSVLESVSPLISNGAMVSTELLLKAHLNGHKYHQIGVHHYQRRTGQSTGSNIKVIVKAIKDTFMLKFRLSKKTASQRLSSLAVTLKTAYTI